MKPLLHIVITDFNGYAQTRRCLATISACMFKDIAITVVDHGTTDETRTHLASEFPAVTRLEGSCDLWWAGATNMGIRAALAEGADQIMLLNNDCYMPPHALSVLIKQAQNQHDAIIAPVQRDWHSGMISLIIPRSWLLLGFPTFSWRQRLTPSLIARALLPVRLIVGGRGVIIPSSIFQTIGLFDEINFPHYGADHDFFWRAVKRGIPLFVATEAIVDVDATHTSSASVPEAMTFSQFVDSLKNIRSHRNITHITALFKKHYPIPKLYAFGVALYYIRYLIVYLIKRIGFLLAPARRRP